MARLLAFVVVSTALLGCDPLRWRGALSGDRAATTVVLIGDSLTSEASPFLDPLLDVGYRWRYSTGMGWTWADAARDLDVVASPAPDVLFIGLGTNDAWRSVPTTDTIAAMDHLLGRFPASCTVAMLVDEDATPRSTKRTYDRAAAAAINDELRRRADVLVDWPAVNDGMLRDGIHATDPEGKQLMAELMTAGIRGCVAPCTQWQGSTTTVPAVTGVQGADGATADAEAPSICRAPVTTVPAAVDPVVVQPPG